MKALSSTSATASWEPEALRVPFAELLAEAVRKRSAVGAFTCYNFETAYGVLEAAASRGVGVILLVGEKSFTAPSGRSLVAGLAAMVEISDASSCVQLDHVTDFATIERAFEWGVGAALADGSRLPVERNAEFVARAVLTARRFGGAIEAELGAIAGDEDVATRVAAGALTDPDEAALFVEQSGAGCLAISIGNVHGVYDKPPALDWPRLRTISAQVNVPLALHGVSGLADEDLRRAIGSGIAKVNVNTELRERYLAATAGQLASVTEGSRVLELNLAQADAISEVVAGKLDVFAPGSLS